MRYAGMWSPTEFQFLRSPVAAAAVVQRRAQRVERHRVDVRVVPAPRRAVGEARGVLEVLVEQVDRQVDDLAQLRVAGEPVHLGQPGERVDLLVARDRVVVVAELGGEDLPLGAVGQHA